MGDMIDRDAVLATIKQQVELWEKGTLVCGLDDLLGLYLPQAIAALPAVTVGVKPLVWVEDFADHPFGWYETIDCGDCIVLTQSGVTVGSFPTTDAAKAAAQADYEARIRAALEPQPVLTANPVDDSRTPDPAVKPAPNADVIRAAGDPARPIGVWDEVREDATGLYVKGRILTDLKTLLRLNKPAPPSHRRTARMTDGEAP